MCEKHVWLLASVLHLRNLEYFIQRLTYLQIDLSLLVGMKVQFGSEVS